MSLYFYKFGALVCKQAGSGGPGLALLRLSALDRARVALAVSVVPPMYFLILLNFCLEQQSKQSKLESVATLPGLYTFYTLNSTSP